MNAKEMEIITLILNKSKDKLKSAKINFENKMYEDAVSRAYYSVFHAISAVLSAKGFDFSSHKETIGKFNLEFVKTKIFPEKFTKNINRLFQNRQKSDYDIKSDINENSAKKDIDDAEEIINKIFECFKDVYSVE